MSKTKKLTSIFLAAVMILSLLSGFCLTSAADASDVDKLIYTPFSAVANNPGYGSIAPSGVIFVSPSWKSESIADNSWVYMDFNGEIYKAIKGVNAFGTISSALDKAGVANMKIKLGAGTYTEDITLNLNGLKFYGNYAGVNPNVMGANAYTMNLNPVRDPNLESIIKDSHWTWTINSNNITIDGVTVQTTLGGKCFDIAVSGQTSEYFYFYNNIVKDSTISPVFNANRGISVGTYLKYNRFTNNTGTIFQGGGAMNDTVMDNNYFEGNKGMLYAFTSCGGNGHETLNSFSNNIVNNCTQGLNFNYDNANFGANLDYKRIVGNMFYNTGSGSKYIIRGNYTLEYFKNPEDEAPIDCNDPGCKTFISDNIFQNIQAGVSPVKLDGGGNLTGRTVNFVASVIKNKFLYAAANTSNRLAVTSTLIGTVDASNNLYGTVNANGTVKVETPTDTMFNINEDTRIITMPYYLDIDMTTLSGGIELKPGTPRTLMANGFETRDKEKEFSVDNSKTNITAWAAAGKETVDFTNAVSGADGPADYVMYSDFLLTEPIHENKLDILDTTTRAFLVATDALTGMSVKYNVVVQADTDKTKADLRYVIDGSTMAELEGYTIDGTNVDIDIPSKYLYFPFSLRVSPSANYQLFTDEAMTTLYNNPTNYIEPDRELVLYAKVTSGDGSNVKVYRLSITRPGTSDHDARIISVVSPEQDVLIFNNERKSISYRPFAMVNSATFDFVVSTNATYEIYKNYNPETGELSELLSRQGDVKEIPIGDGISYFYVKVTSSFGFSQVYDLVVYNDVKSSDNVITGITGMTDVPIENNVIYLEISSTLTAVNAHFETNVFADVRVYADEAKTYALKPAVTYTTVNNREVEVRTFRMGATCQVSYFYVDVIAETGDVNSYKVIITKGATSVPFTDIDNHWSKEYVLEAARIGIVGGYHDAETDTYTFEPNRFATRQEVAAMFCRMMGIDPLSFNGEILTGIYEDADDISEWAYNYVKAAYFLGIMTGSKNLEGKQVFNCKANITRQEFFQAMSNLLKLDTEAAASQDLSGFKDADKVSNWALPATKAVVKAGIIEGADGYLNPKDNIKRGEIAKIVSMINIIAGDVK